VSDLTVPNISRNERLELAQPPSPLAVVVFRKLIDHAASAGDSSENRATGPPFSLLTVHNQQLSSPRALQPRNCPMRAGARATLAPVFHRTVDTPSSSYYQALAYWEFDHRPQFILSLASSRTPTLQNVRQTLTAILVGRRMYLALSVSGGRVLGEALHRSDRRPHGRRQGH